MQAVAQLGSCTIRRNRVQAVYSTVAPDNNYRYNGKELNGDYGMDLYEYGFRWYDAAIGRFTGVDPIADQFAWVNTYNYAENEPVGSIDLWGLQRLPMQEGAENPNWLNPLSTTGTSPINIYNSQLRINYSKEAAKLEPLYSKFEQTSEHIQGVNKRTQIKESTRSKMIGGRAHLDASDPIEPKYSSSEPGKANPRFFKTNKSITNLAQGSRALGALGVAATTYELGVAANEGRFVEQAEIEGGKIAGALAGMKMASGMVASSPIPATKHPVVAIVLVGAGGVAGSIGGEQAVRSMQNSIKVDFNTPIKRGWNHTTCFVKGTKILMANGQEKNIELIKRGDKILSVNTEKMLIEEDVVTHIPENIRTYRKIRMKLADKNIIEFSPAHPFWIAGKGWSVFDLEEAKHELDFEVNEIEVGDDVLMYLDHKLVRVKVVSLEDTGEIVEMFNLENVKVNHSFFANGILVHNKRL
jgi:RHS repeat-associated protein